MMKTQEVLIKEAAGLRIRDDNSMSVDGVCLPDIGVRGLPKAGTGSFRENFGARYSGRINGERSSRR
jgi:hypothetical protein